MSYEGAVIALAVDKRPARLADIVLHNNAGGNGKRFHFARYDKVKPGVAPYHADIPTCSFYLELKRGQSN